MIKKFLTSKLYFPFQLAMCLENATLIRSQVRGQINLAKCFRNLQRNSLQGDLETCLHGTLAVLPKYGWMITNSITMLQYP